MIASALRRTIESCARDFNVKAVWLFGSAALDETQAADRFFDFYARLFFELPKPVDLVDLSLKPSIESIIREKGVCIYERGTK
jgi:hypothetical protein